MFKVIINYVLEYDNSTTSIFQTELVTSKGYPCEEYEVSTADGYILGVQRIPYGVKGHGIGQRPVVFLQHGLLCDSTLWVTNIVQDSLGNIKWSCTNINFILNECCCIL